MLKGLFRVCRRYGSFDAIPRNIFAAFRDRPPSHRPITDISPGVAYHFHHLGFDYRTLEDQLRVRLRLADKMV
jgi:hypothetical protein